MEHQFQIDLGGLISLLSEHLYSGPEVFLRELIQNGVDAISARRNVEIKHQGHVKIELLGSAPTTLVLHDNGIGLTEAEIHKFLATIGRSAKSGDWLGNSRDFLGQFGIGLLSCFVVSDEITLITRSAKAPDSETLKWTGQANGKYLIETIDSDIAPGSQVYLRAKPEFEKLFQFESIKKLATKFASLLPFKVELVHGENTVRIDNPDIPWRKPELLIGGPLQQQCLEFGKEVFEERFFDAIPVLAGQFGVEGVALILPFTPSLAAKPKNRVYLKGMFLGDGLDELLPDWAFFARCILDVSNLRPTASRESFVSDQNLADCRAAISAILKNYLKSLAKSNPRRLEQFLAIHHLAIKNLALHDDDCLELFMDWLPFETTMGLMSFGDIKKQGDQILYVMSRDQFRQIAPIARSQNTCVVNAAYVHEADLLERYQDAGLSHHAIQLTDSTEIAEQLKNISPEEEQKSAALLKEAQKCLSEFDCDVNIRTFTPDNLPAIVSINQNIQFKRDIERSKPKVNKLWGSMLDAISDSIANKDKAASLTFNMQNALISQLCDVDDPELLKSIVRTLYTQALMLGHHPLGPKELTALTAGLQSLISRAIDSSKASQPTHTPQDSNSQKTTDPEQTNE